MLHTGLVLGANWSADEWPESVDVMHEGVGDSLKYVPERTCSYVEHSDGAYHYYRCSECQCEMAGWDFELYSPNYCMDCGAKITEVVSDTD